MGRGDTFIKKNINFENKISAVSFAIFYIRKLKKVIDLAIVLEKKISSLVVSIIWNLNLVISKYNFDIIFGMRTKSPDKKVQAIMSKASLFDPKIGFTFSRLFEF